MLNEDMSSKPPESTAGFLKLPDWLKYDPTDPEQRRNAGIAIAILAIGGGNWDGYNEATLSVMIDSAQKVFLFRKGIDYGGY